MVQRVRTASMHKSVSNPSALIVFVVSSTVNSSRALSKAVARTSLIITMACPQQVTSNNYSC